MHLLSKKRERRRGKIKGTDVKRYRDRDRDKQKERRERERKGKRHREREKERGGHPSENLCRRDRFYNLTSFMTRTDYIFMEHKRRRSRWKQ